LAETLDSRLNSESILGLDLFLLFVQYSPACPALKALPKKQSCQKEIVIEERWCTALI
jgi:hypothetical protein